MLLFIILSIAAIIGIIYGIQKKNKTSVIVSVIVLIIITTIMVYFYLNPY